MVGLSIGRSKYLKHGMVSGVSWTSLAGDVETGVKRFRYSQFGHSFSQTCKLGRTSIEKLPKNSQAQTNSSLIGKMKYRLTKGRQL